MRTHTIITITIADYEVGNMLPIIANLPVTIAQTKELFGRVHYRLELDDDGIADNVLSVLREREINHLIIRQSYYSEAELAAASLLFMQIDAPPVRMTLSPATYEGGCPRCGTAAKQIGAITLDASALPRAPCAALQTARGHVLLSEEVVQRCPNGLDLRPVKLASGNRPTMHQLVSSAVLPPFGEHTVGVRQQHACPECDRDGFGMLTAEPFTPRYEFESIDRRFPQGLPEVASTYECFGNSMGKDDVRRYGPAQPLIAVGQYLRGAIMACSDSSAKLRWTPLQLERRFMT